MMLKVSDFMPYDKRLYTSKFHGGRTNTNSPSFLDGRSTLLLILTCRNVPRQ